MSKKKKRKLKRPSYGLDFYKDAPSSWHCYTGNCKIEVIRVGRIWLASAFFDDPDDPYYEYYDNRPFVEGGRDRIDALVALLSTIGIPKILGLPDDGSSNLPNEYEINIRWQTDDNQFEEEKLPSDREQKEFAIHFCEEDTNHFVFYYYRTCKIEVAICDSCWIAAATPLGEGRDDFLSITCHGSDLNEALGKLLHNPDLMMLLGFSEDDSTTTLRDLFRIWVKFPKETDSSQISLRPECRFPHHCECNQQPEKCPLCAAWGWGYFIRWDD